MKKSIINQTSLILLLLFTTAPNAFSQFNSAGASENPASLSVNPFNVNNDILDDGTDIYRVSIFTDANVPTPIPGISWEVYYSGTYSNNTVLSLSGIASATNLYFADVCLVKDIGDNSIHAVTAWYVTTSIFGNGWEIEDFQWNGSGFVSNGLTFIASGGGGTTVNIDADDAGNIIVVYDDYLNNIWTVTGTLSSGLTLNSSVFTIPGAGMYPDVSIYNGGSHEAYFTFVDVGSGELHIDYSPFSTLVSGSNSNVNPSITPFPPIYYNFSFPRIACPNISGPNDWMVVVQEDDRYTYLIDGFNNNTGSTPVYYNDGTYTAPSCDLTGEPNFFPVVTYDANQNIWVGWTMDNRTGNIGCALDAQYPVVVPCNGVGAPSGSSYWDVPSSLGSQDDFYGFSISSRNSASDIFLSYFNFSPSYDLITKWVSTGASSFRSLDNKNNIDISYDAKEDLLNILSLSNVRLFVYDLQGKLLIQEKGTGNQIVNSLNAHYKNLQTSIYLTKVISDDGKFNLTRKISLTANK